MVVEEAVRLEHRREAEAEESKVEASGALGLAAGNEGHVGDDGFRAITMLGGARGTDGKRRRQGEFKFHVRP